MYSVLERILGGEGGGKVSVMLGDTKIDSEQEYFEVYYARFYSLHIH